MAVPVNRAKTDADAAKPGVKASSVQPNDIRDVKGPLDLPSSFLPILTVLGLIFFMGLAYLLAKFMIRAKKNIEIERRKKPHETALERLDALWQGRLIRDGKIKEFYFELSMIVRYYLEARFGLNAPEMTTEEFMSSLKESSALNHDHKSALREFMSYCDLVKFAKYGPTEKDIQMSFDSAKNLVLQTKPAEEDKSKGSAKK